MILIVIFPFILILASLRISFYVQNEMLKTHANHLLATLTLDTVLDNSLIFFSYFSS